MLGRIFVLLIAAAFLSLAAVACKRYSPNRDDAKLKEVLHLWESIPIYPGCSQVDQHHYSKDYFATVSKGYKCDVTYDQVKGFYLLGLEGAGWTLVRERELGWWFGEERHRELTFRNGEYWVILEYAGEKANAGWAYGVTVKWES
jgi:hypothetical protein